MSRITFGGLASGLDTNNLINQLVELERQPIVRKEKRITELERIRDTWRDINMRLRNLRDTVLGLKERDNFLSMRAGSTEPSRVAATAGYNANPATYELQVNQLATHHTVAMLTDIQTRLGRSATAAMGLNGTFRLKDLAAGDGTYKEITVQSTDSLTALQHKINNAGAGVTASIIAGHLVMKSNMTGAANGMAMAYVSGQDILQTLGIYHTGTSTYYNQTVVPQDAHFSINGISAVRAGNVVDDLVADVTFRFMDATSGPVYVQVAADTERAITALGSFVEQYNSVNQFIREKLEKRDPDSKDTSRGLLQGDTTLMKIERSLRTLINSPVSGYRYQDEEGNWQQKKYYSLATLGVMTMDKDGYLQFNENKLAAALQDDPEGVFSVLQFELLDEHGVGTGRFSGVAVELDNYLKRLLLTEQDSQGRPLRPISVQQEAAVQRRIDELRRHIQIREARLLRYEERLVRQFTSLERYISTMQSQSQEMENMIRQFTGFGSNNSR